MAGWTRHKGRTVVLPLDHVDTDQLIPARFMSVPRSEGYGDYLLHDLRRDETGDLHPAFPLNREDGISILVAGHHFGTGSSREAAVYALVDAGIRAVVAPSFGDIFAGNAVNNGLLPARIDPEHAALLAELLGDGAADTHIDLERRQIAHGETVLPFELDESWRTKLINGWDDIDLTLQHAAAIDRFRNNRSQTASWAWPAAAD
ncbi:MAG: 3-isopropylmalate dehydratase small subunit [Alphaproteobacteria bacterium]|nr:3-isopropylmalate dehydratase small subunit [Alphaproteobacteria bacterium]